MRDISPKMYNRLILDLWIPLEEELVSSQMGKISSLKKKTNRSIVSIETPELP